MAWIPTALFIAAEGIALGLGGLHLWILCRSDLLGPADRNLREALARERLALTSETTLERAWVGFNASHSLGLILHGAVFGILVFEEPSPMTGPSALPTLGLASLLGYAYLAAKYWFSVPRRFILLSSALFASAWVLGSA